MTQNLKASAQAAFRIHPYQASSPQNEGEPSVARPLSWRPPVQDGANAHQADASVQDGVTDQMNLAFVGHRAQEAQRLAAEDKDHASCDHPDGRSARNRSTRGIRFDRHAQ